MLVVAVEAVAVREQAALVGAAQCALVDLAGAARCVQVASTGAVR